MTGRWPANVILSPEMGAALDAQSGTRSDGARTGPGRVSGDVFGKYAGDKMTRKGIGDAGGASRFFLSAGYEPWELDWIYESGLRPYGTDKA